MIFYNSNSNALYVRDHYGYYSTFSTSELIVVADDLDDDDFHFLFRSELLPVVAPDPRPARDHYY